MKYYTYKLKLGLLNILSIILFIFLFCLTLLIVDDLTIFNINFTVFLILVLGLMLVHELLHGLGFLSLGKINKNNITFGIELEKGIFYTMCKESVSKLNIIIALLFPFVFIGLLTYIIGLVCQSGVLIFLSIINMASSIGDLIMVIAILEMPNDIRYLDLDNTNGFTIISKSDLSKEKYFGIKLENTGKYTDKIKAKDFQKLRITKLSKWLLLAYLVLIFVVTIINV